ncbi:DUF2806 domain-containing protein [Rhizobium sp. ZPR3]|uniref:DUF2806 domain-containing protein n=2 Tax=unclassified Rhizobium TaxID=2613769 RepID=A0AAU7S7P5_9HYPH
MPNEDGADKSLLSINVNDIFGFGKAAEKLSPTGAKIVEGLAKILDPALSSAKIYLEERARGAAIRHETKSNIRQIASVDSLLVSDPELAEQMRNRLVATEMRRRANIHQTVEKALTIAAGSNHDEIAQNLDEDFLQEWVEGIKDVSSEVVQSVWAALLANAPKQFTGRVSKPALELLKQFDQPTAEMFLEFAKVWAAVGYPSTNAPANWAPFEKPIHFPILEEIGIIKSVVYQAYTLPGLGYIAQIKEAPQKFGGINTLQVYSWGHRAFELGQSILQSPFEIDDELVLSARKQNIEWLTNDTYWSHAIAYDENAYAKGAYSFIISPVNQTYNSVEENVRALREDNSLDDGWREALLSFAESGRLKVYTAS